MKNKLLQHGESEVVGNASKFASGIYLYSLTAGDIIKTKKMVLLK